MKKRIYFMISSLVLIILSTLTIVSVDKYIDSFAKLYEDVPGDLGERVLSLLEHSGHIYFISISAITILISGVIIYLAYQDKLIKHKGLVIGLSIIAFFTTYSNIAQLLLITNIIVMALTKRVRKEDFPDKKKKLPNMKKEEINNNKIISSIVLILIYFSETVWNQYLPDNEKVVKIISFCFALSLILSSIIVFYDLLKASIKEFRKNFKAYVQNLLPLIGVYYLVYFGVTMLSYVLSGGNIANNQTSVEELPFHVLIPLAIIYAPIVEESIFRGSLRRFVRNDKLFIALSAILFGLLHTLSSETSLYMSIVLSLPYATMGGFLAYLYVKTNNICSNMAFHALHNTFATIMSLLIMGI